MKKKFLYIAMFAMGAFFASCDPETIDGPAAWDTIAADALELTATPIQVDGKNSNEFMMENKSPINSQWIVPQLIEANTIAPYSFAKLYATQIGDIPVTFRGMNAGELVEKIVTVRVDTITYLTDELKNRLCVGQTGGPTYFGVASDKAKFVVEQSLCEDGVTKGNSIVVKSNTNPVLCNFTWGGGALDTNIGKITTYALGEYDLIVEVMNAAGHKQTYNLGTYVAEDYSDLPAEITQITGYHPINSPTATKTWKLADGAHWGNGGSTDKSASWWSTTVDSQGGSTGTMTFDFANGIISKTIDDESNERGDKSSTGTFSLDFSTANESTNVLCSIKTGNGGNIVFPYLSNENYKEINIFNVVALSDEDMWLRGQPTPGTDHYDWEGTFWHFVVVE